MALLNVLFIITLQLERFSEQITYLPLHRLLVKQNSQYKTKQKYRKTRTFSYKCILFLFIYLLDKAAMYKRVKTMTPSPCQQSAIKETFIPLSII